MKILQRNLNRSTFVVREMKRNVSAVRLILATRNSGPPASLFPAWCASLLIYLSIGWGRLHNTAVRECECMCECMCEFTQDSWKMYRYTLKEWVFIVRTYWKTESIKSYQQQFLERSWGRHPPSKSSIWALSKKLETEGNLLDEHTGGSPKISEETIQNVEDRILASPKKSLRRLSQESGLSRSTCQSAAKKREASCVPYLRGPRIKIAWPSAKNGILSMVSDTS